MNVIAGLLLLFILLSVLILGKTSLYALSGLFLNILLFFVFIRSLQGIAIYSVTLGYILLNALITLFYVNGWNAKTKAAFLSLLLFLILLTVVFVPLIQKLSISGFSSYELEELAALDLNVPQSFAKLSVAVILIGVSGDLIDGSMAIASATHEIYRQGESFGTLFFSSMTVVKNILNSTINTLLFAFISSGLALVFFLSGFENPLVRNAEFKGFCF